MAQNKTHFLGNAVLNHTLRAAAGGTAFTQPPGVWVALFLVTPTKAGGGTEVTGSGYLRVAATFGVPANSITSNTIAVVFPKSLAPWGDIVAIALMSAVTGGNMLYWGPLTEGTLTVDASNRKIEFEIGAIVVQED